MKCIFLAILDSVGIGITGDAEGYGGRGSRYPAASYTCFSVPVAEKIKESDASRKLGGRRHGKLCTGNK